MIISMYIGAHCTNGAQLMRGLLKNKDILAQHDIAVPAPARYRDLLPKVMKKVKSQRASPDTQDMLLDQILEMDDCARMVLSYEDIICMNARIFEKGEFYNKVDFKLPWLRNVFAHQPMEFMIGLRNPATFIPETFAQCGPEMSYSEFLNGLDPRTIRWSDLLLRIRQACPDVGITCFAYEDTPITWSQVMREMAGLGPMVPLAGGLDILSTIMKREGMKRLRTYLHTHQPQTERQRRQILQAFLDKYVDESALEEEIDLPGWTEDLVDELSDLYEEDLMRIEAMQDVHFIAP